MFRGPAHFYEDQDAIRLRLKRRETTKAVADPQAEKAAKEQRKIELALADRQFIGTFSKLVLAACHVMRVGEKDFYSTARTPDILKARWIVCWMASTQFNRSYKNIGDRIGRDHATVIHAVNTVNDKWETYAPLIQRVAEIIGHEFKGEVPFQ